MPGAESYLSPAAQAILGRYGDLMKTRIEDVKQQNAADTANLNTATQAWANNDFSTYDKATNAATKSWNTDDNGNLTPFNEVFNRRKPNLTAEEASAALKAQLIRQQEFDARRAEVYKELGIEPPPKPKIGTVPKPGTTGAGSTGAGSTGAGQSANTNNTSANTNTNASAPPPLPLRQNTQSTGIASGLTADDLNNLRISDYLERNDYNNMLQTLKGIS